MSGSFESVRWNACVHRLDLGLYSHPKEILGNRVRAHVNSKEKIPSTEKILLRGGLNPRRCVKQDREPNSLPTSYSGPFPSSPMVPLTVQNPFHLHCCKRYGAADTKHPGVSLPDRSFCGASPVTCQPPGTCCNRKS